MNDTYVESIHVITDINAYKEEQMSGYRKRMKERELDENADNSHCKFKGCWCHAKIKPLPNYLDEKRKAGLIDPPEVEAPEDVDEGYEEIMARKWDYIVVASAKSWNNDTMLNELLSAGRLGLLNGIRTWNQSKGQQTTYYNRCVKNAMINEMRKQATYDRYHVHLEEAQFGVPADSSPGVEDKTKGYEGYDVMTWEDFVADQELLNPEEVLLRKEQVEKAKAILANVIGAMTEREQFVFHHRILEKSMTLEEIAEKYGCSHMAIKRDEERIKEKLKELKED
jgi:RNA polymerase sigma factor (sigma-70 family)